MDENLYVKFIFHTKILHTNVNCKINITYRFTFVYKINIKYKFLRTYLYIRYCIRI